MPIYAFECPGQHVTEREFPMASKPKSISCSECGKSAKSIIQKVAMVIPSYMKAQGSAGSTEDQSDRMAHYRQSDEWKKERAELEASGAVVKEGDQAGK